MIRVSRARIPAGPPLLAPTDYIAGRSRPIRNMAGGRLSSAGRRLTGCDGYVVITVTPGHGNFHYGLLPGTPDRPTIHPIPDPSLCPRRHPVDREVRLDPSPRLYHPLDEIWSEMIRGWVTYRSGSARPYGASRGRRRYARLWTFEDRPATSGCLQ